VAESGSVLFSQRGKNGKQADRDNSRAFAPALKRGFAFAVRRVFQAAFVIAIAY